MILKLINFIFLLFLKLLLLLFVIPAKILKLFSNFFTHFSSSQSSSAAPKRQLNILITGVRSPYSLELARLFHKSGHIVHAAETSYQTITMLLFSFMYGKYHLLKCTPNQEPFELFRSQLITICIREKIDLLIPTCEEVFWVSRHKEYIEQAVRAAREEGYDSSNSGGSNNESFSIFTETLDVMRILHNKFLFNQHVLKQGLLKAPYSELLTSKNELIEFLNKTSQEKREFNANGFVLKPAYSRFGSSTIIIDKKSSSSLLQDLKESIIKQVTQNDKISVEYPWVAQEFIPGKILCSYSVVRNGKVQAHTVYTGGEFTSSGTVLGGSLAFVKCSEAITHKTLVWVKEFVSKCTTSDCEKFKNGQICFDFILEQETEELYPIECNPRGTSGIHLFSDLHTEFTNCFIEQKEATLVPRVPQHRDSMLALAMIVYLVLHCPYENLQKWVNVFLQSKDAIFEWRDPLPFFIGQFIAIVEPFWKMAYYRVNYVETFTRDIEWNGEQ